MSAPEFTSAWQHLADHSWALFESPNLARLSQTLLAEALQIQDQMRPAKIGKESGLQHLPSVRNDAILWRDFPKDSAAGIFLNDLKQKMNEEFYLGLDGIETHFAHYSAGGSYDWHIDQSKVQGRQNRIMTFVLYLNANWLAEDGGALEIMNETPVLPLGGRLMVFRSEKILHRVCESRSDRWSLTGWFLRSNL